MCSQNRIKYNGIYLYNFHIFYLIVKKELTKRKEKWKNYRREVSLVMHLSCVLLLKSLLLFESQWKISMRKYCDKSYDVFETNFEFRNYGIWSWSIIFRREVVIFEIWLLCSTWHVVLRAKQKYLNNYFFFILIRQLWIHICPDFIFFYSIFYYWSNKS